MELRASHGKRKATLLLVWDNAMKDFENAGLHSLKD
jgi:hypothetical protein